MDTFARNLGVRVIHVDAAAEFLGALAGVADPERKRKIIGKEFVDVFQREAAKLPGVKWLAQGTIYPDVIESAGAKTKKAHTIKSHHNVGGLPETLHLKLLEPLRELFKDEVRELGLALGLPARWCSGIPSPAPVSASASWARSRANTPSCCAAPTRSSSTSCASPATRPARAGTTSRRKAFAVFLPVRSVGVMGDGRSYEHASRCAPSRTTDFMTAHWAPLPHDLLAKVSNRIINEVRGINRVVYDISGKPPATIEWE